MRLHPACCKHRNQPANSIVPTMGMAKATVMDEAAPPQHAAHLRFRAEKKHQSNVAYAPRTHPQRSPNSMRADTRPACWLGRLAHTAPRGSPVLPPTGYGRRRKRRLGSSRKAAMRLSPVRGQLQSCRRHCSKCFPLWSLAMPGRRLAHSPGIHETCSREVSRRHRRSATAIRCRRMPGRKRRSDKGDHHQAPCSSHTAQARGRAAKSGPATACAKVAPCSTVENRMRHHLARRSGGTGPPGQPSEARRTPKGATPVRNSRTSLQPSYPQRRRTGRT